MKHFQPALNVKSPSGNFFWKSCESREVKYTLAISENPDPSLPNHYVGRILKPPKYDKHLLKLQKYHRHLLKVYRCDTALLLVTKCH